MSNIQLVHDTLIANAKKSDSSKPNQRQHRRRLQQGIEIEYACNEMEEKPLV